MTDAALNRMIDEALTYDASEEQEGVFRQKDKAKGLENILYRCADCGALYTTRGVKNELVCAACGKTHRLNERYLFEDEPRSIGAYYAKIKDLEKAEIGDLHLETDVDTNGIGHIGSEPATEGIVLGRPYLNDLERVDCRPVQVDGDAVGRLSEGKTKQPLLHQLALQQHLGGVGLDEGQEGEAEGVGGTHQGVDETHLLVGKVVKEVGVHILEGNGEERNVGQAVEPKLAFFVGTREIVGGLTEGEREKTIT